MNEVATGKGADGFDEPLPVGALAHYYRGAMARSNAWRNIVDNTTDWAVAATAGMLSFGIAGPGNRQIILFVAHFFILMFLLIEARRYSYYISIDWRVRLIERDYFASVLLGQPEAGGGSWRKRLAQELLTPHRPLDLWEAFSLRLKRTYIWIFLILTLAWIARVTTYPEPVTSFSQLWAQSGFSSLPGWLFWLVICGIYVILISALRQIHAINGRLEAEGFSIGLSRGAE